MPKLVFDIRVHQRLDFKSLQLLGYGEGVFPERERTREGHFEEEFFVVEIMSFSL